MKLKIIYRKNLKMSPGKLAAQTVHAALGLGANDAMMSVVVLAVSDKRFKEIVEAKEMSPAIERAYVVHDAGYTEVPPGTQTCAAFYEDF